MKIEKIIERIQSYNKIHHDEHLEKAIEILEKEIRKYVDFSECNASGLPLPKCPVCKKRLFGRFDERCNNCGQLLQWVKKRRYSF